MKRSFLRLSTFVNFAEKALTLYQENFQPVIALFALFELRENRNSQYFPHQHLNSRKVAKKKNIGEDEISFANAKQSAKR